MSAEGITGVLVACLCTIVIGGGLLWIASIFNGGFGT